MLHQLPVCAELWPYLAPSATIGPWRMHAMHGPLPRRCGTCHATAAPTAMTTSCLWPTTGTRRCCLCTSRWGASSTDKSKCPM